MRAISPGHLALLLLVQIVGAVLGSLVFALVFGVVLALLLSPMSSGFDGLIVLVFGATFGVGVGAGVGAATAGQSFGERGSMALASACGAASTAPIALAVILLRLNLREAPLLAGLAVVIVALSATIGYNVRHQPLGRH